MPAILHRMLGCLGTVGGGLVTRKLQVAGEAAMAISDYLAPSAQRAGPMAHFVMFPRFAIAIRHSYQESGGRTARCFADLRKVVKAWGMGYTT